MSSPEFFNQMQNEIFTSFVGNIKTYKFTDHLPKNNKQRHMLVGSICAGKSSLLNKQLKLELKTGKGHTTKDIKVVASSSTVEIVDTPGISIDEFNLYEM